MSIAATCIIALSTGSILGQEPASPNHDSPATPSVSRLAALVDSWFSVDFEVTHHLIDPSRKTPDGDRYETLLDQHYIATATGQRYLRLISRDPGSVDSVYTSYSDGEKCIDTTQEGSADAPQKQYVIKREFSDEGRSSASAVPPPFRYLYLERKSLAAGLGSSRPVGERNILDRPCDVFVLGDVVWTLRPVTLVYALDRETGWPLQVTCFNSEADRIAHLPVWDWIAESFEPVGRYMVPIESRESLFIRPTPADGSSDPVEVTRQLRVTRCIFDQQYAADFFRPRISPGASVWDQIQNRHWTEPDPNATAPSSAPDVAALANRRMAPPASWAKSLPLVGLLVGSVLLALGGRAWWLAR